MHADASQSLKLRSRLPVGWVGFHAVRLPLTAVSALRTVSYGLERATASGVISFVEVFHPGYRYGVPQDSPRDSSFTRRVDWRTYERIVHDSLIEQLGVIAGATSVKEGYVAPISTVWAHLAAPMACH
jgi:hypothetical protein